MSIGKTCGDSSRGIRIALCILSCFFTLTALSLVICELLFDTIERNLITKNLVITEDSASFKVLKTETISKIEFYLFNLTNAREWEKNGTKPRLKAVGPYVYRRIAKKNDMRFIETTCNQRFLQYTTSITYHFEPNGSIGDPKKDSLTMVNFVERTASSMISQAGSFTTKALWYLITKPLYLNLTADAIMWGHEYRSLATGKILGLVGDAKIGLFNRLNNTVHGPFKCDTGATNISRLGDLVAFKKKTEIDNWGSDYANMLNGTVDVITPPSVKIGDRRYTFSTDLCRSVPLVAKKWVSAKNYPKLKLLDLEMERKVFHSADEEPENAAFHLKVYPTDKYPPTGLLSMSPCVDFGIAGDEPLFISLPFFNQAAAEVKDAVIFDGPTEPNLIPSARIDPKTGIMVEGEVYYQINIFLSKEVQGTPKDIYFPLAHIKIKAYADRESAEQLYQMVYAFPAVTRKKLRALIGVSIALTVLLLIAALVLYRRERRHMSALFEEEWSFEEEISEKKGSF
ncbi:Lysosome membrane protein 2 [Taenia solium]